MFSFFKYELYWICNCNLVDSFIGNLIKKPSNPIANNKKKLVRSINKKSSNLIEKMEENQKIVLVIDRKIVNKKPLNLVDN